MADEPKVNFLEEAEGMASVIKLSLLVELVRMIDRNGLQEAADDWIATGDPDIMLSVKTANEMKKFVIEHRLHEKERIGKIVLLSAHCGCRGKSGQF